MRGIWVPERLVGKCISIVRLIENVRVANIYRRSAAISAEEILAVLDCLSSIRLESRDVESNVAG
jgi:hypothetical protein